MSCTPDKDRLQPLYSILEAEPSLPIIEGDENVDSEISFQNHAELVLYPQSFPVTSASEREVDHETLRQQLFSRFQAELETEVENHFFEAAEKAAMAGPTYSQSSHSTSY